MKLAAAGQWMSGENTFGFTDYWFHRQYVWRIAVQLFQSGGDNPSYLAGDCELRRSLGDSTQVFFCPEKPRHQYLWWRGSRPFNKEPTVIDDAQRPVHWCTGASGKKVVNRFIDQRYLQPGAPRGIRGPETKLRK